MAYKTRIFIDFWNFQLSWNARTSNPETGEPGRCDWKAVPRVLTEAASEVIRTVDAEASLSLEETLVHASYNPSAEGDRRLKDWLDTFFGKQPRVSTQRSLLTSLRSHGRRHTRSPFSRQAMPTSYRESSGCRSRGLKVIDAAWNDRGHQLAKSCWGSIRLDTLIPKLTR